MLVKSKLLFLFMLPVSILALLRWSSLSYHFYDFGIWEHRLYSFLRNPLPIAFYFHRPIYWLYIPLYELGGMLPLLFLQCGIVTLSAWIVHRFAVCVLKDSLSACWITLAYLLYSPVWYICLYDFHTDHWFPLLFGLLYYWEWKKEWTLPRLSAVTFLLFAVKEVTPFVLILYFITAYWRSAYMNYLYMFYFTCFTILGGLLLTPYGVTLSTIQPLFPKVFFFFCLFAPFAFLSVMKPTWLAPILFPFIFVLFNSNASHYSIGTQYAIIFTIPIVFSAILGIPEIARWLPRFKRFHSIRITSLIILIVSFMFHALLAPSPLSRQFWFEKYHSDYHWSKFIPTKRDHIIAESLKSLFEERNYIVSVQNSAYHSILAQQRCLLPFPRGLTDEQSIAQANRVVIDTALYGEVYDRIDESLYRSMLKILERDFILLWEYDGFRVYGSTESEF